MFSSHIWRLACLVFAAVTCVVIADTAGKLLTGLGVDPFAVAWTRFFLGALMLLPFSGLSMQEMPKFRDRWILLRAIFIACGVSCILTALKTEPIANVFGAFFVGPIVSYVLAVLFLRERPSLARSILLGVGFMGVMLVVKPGFGASIGMVYALAAGACYGAYLALTRRVATDNRPRFLLISQLLIGALVLTPFGLKAQMPQIDIYVVTLILVSALGSAIGNYWLVIASRNAEASLIAPLVYSQLLSATVLGVLVFGDWPDVYALIGLALIGFSGLSTLLVHQKAL